MLASILLLTATTSGVCVDCLPPVSRRSVIVRDHAVQPLYLVGQYQYANLELIEEIRALRELLASRGIGREPSSAVSRSCGKCHSGEAAKGNFNIDQMTAADKLRAIRAFATGAMPPNGKLAPDLKNQILDELTAVDDDPPATPAPIEEPLP